MGKETTGMSELVDSIMEKGTIVGEFKMLAELEKWMMVQKVGLQHKVNELNKELEEIKGENQK